MFGFCHTIGCNNKTGDKNDDFCEECKRYSEAPVIPAANNEEKLPVEQLHSNPDSLSAKYPKYYKPVGNLTEVDVYAVHKLFDIKDPSGAIQHASKKLLLSGVRTGGKSAYHDIKEARDTLTRWLQLNEDTQ